MPPAFLPAQAGSIELSFCSASEATSRARHLVLAGHAESLAAMPPALLPPHAAPVWAAMVRDLDPGPRGASASSYLPHPQEPGEPAGPTRLTALVLPAPSSRYDAPSTPHALGRLLGGASTDGDGDVGVVCLLRAPEDAVATAVAVARAFPTYSRKTSSCSGGNGDGDSHKTVHVALVSPTEGGARLDEAPDADAVRVAEAVAYAARLTDTPTSELDTDAFVAEARRLAQELGVRVTVIQGEALREGGFGGLWGVGKAATDAPALVALHYEPEAGDEAAQEAAQETVAWVGKGIVYDTGGLSIKGKQHMPGMKGDMGGAAAALGAFAAAVRARPRRAIHAVLCLADNAVGPNAFRPDDILTLYSGKTVEVNNTDAEGRLVLADGVAWAARALRPDVIVDLATLTGAQLVSTGRLIAAIVTDDGELEASAVEAGRRSGDLVHPLPYHPAFFAPEFKSKVADLKNSVSDRMNGQTSAAAQFVAEHLSGPRPKSPGGDGTQEPFRFQGRWLHVDLAGPATVDERGTGFGVALLYDLFVRPGLSSRPAEDQP